MKRLVYERLPPASPSGSAVAGRAAQATAPEVPAAEPSAELVERVLGGDAEAFRALMEAHGEAVLGLCRMLMNGNETEAEDIAQETFVRAYRFLDRLEDRSRFVPWLYQIARSLCRERRRGQALELRVLRERAELVRLESAGRWRAPDAPGADEAMSGALEELPEVEREALLLKYFEGLSYEEISKRLHRTFSQVDHLIRSARARLARRIGVRRRREEEP
ncbi:MAG: RNA polymerase sigma factor [Planctomycetes bacterium]|nr:RNA polymerase sigma factor [Planctomycetota bacterium]